MRYVLYFLVYSCVVIGLFITFAYLMTVVDPGLLHLSEKAARMIRTNVEGVYVPPDELPSEMYVDLSEIRKKSKII